MKEAPNALECGHLERHGDDVVEGLKRVVNTVTRAKGTVICDGVKGDWYGDLV